MHQEDDDIKIATGSFAHRQADSDEEAVRQFLTQKNSGNIEKARLLGELYADVLVKNARSPVFACEKNLMQLEHHHRLLLYSFIVNRVIAENSPNSILAQTSLNVFYSEIEKVSPELHRHVCDMAAFSLYILCERSPNRGDEEFGAIYAGLCGFGGHEDIIAEGNAFYKKAYDFCTDKIKAVHYE